MIITDDDGTIILYQGDSGEITVSGLDSSKSYTVYFAIQDEKRNKIGNELQVSANQTETVTFILTAAFTDLLTVPANQPYKVYYYGIKACSADEDAVEDTLFVAGSNYGDVNRIIVYPRKVMGV